MNSIPKTRDWSALGFLTDGTCCVMERSLTEVVALHPGYQRNPARKIQLPANGHCVLIGCSSASLRMVKTNRLKSLSVKSVDCFEEYLFVELKDGTRFKERAGSDTEIHIWQGGNDTWGKLASNMTLDIRDGQRSLRIASFIGAEGNPVDPLDESLRLGTTGIKPIESLETGLIEGARWTGAFTPERGMRVQTTINSLGKGTVEGLFVLDGFVGAFVVPDSPPTWWRRQNPCRRCYTLFGPEMMAAS